MRRIRVAQTRRAVRETIPVYRALRIRVLNGFDRGVRASRVLVPGAFGDDLIASITPAAEASVTGAFGATARIYNLDIEIGGRLDEHIAELGERMTDTATRQRAMIMRTLNRLRAGSINDEQARSILTQQTEGSWRSMRIARTETATLTNVASVDALRDGDYTHVAIIDGPDCGWTEHRDPDHANGSVRSLREFENYPIAHPNCVRQADAPLRRRS